MTEFKKKRIGRWVNAIIVVLVIVAGSPPVWLDRAIAAQSEPRSRQKLVEIEPMGEGDALWIFDIAIGDQQIEPRVPFQAGDNWLKDMSILLRNRTDKTIDYLEIRSRFPEGGNGRTEPLTAYHIQLGQIPAVDRFNGKGEPMRVDPSLKPLGLAPGGSLAVHFADYFDSIRAIVEQKMPFEQVTRCIIHRGLTYFSDGLKWYNGFYERPNPDQPGKFLFLPDDYFPGNPMKFWPPPWTKMQRRFSSPTPALSQ